jgi:RNA recognition motif-containing protein
MSGIQQPNLPFTGTSKEPISTEMEATSGSLEHPSITANPTQLKKQAMGALLSLFPHNIRYDELVQEGIDPIVLRKLYDEIGVKVVSSSPHPGVNVQQTTPPLFDFVGSNLLPTTSVSTSSQPLDISAAQSAPQNSMAKTQDIVEVATRPDTRKNQSLSKVPPMDPIGPNESRSAYIARMVAARTAKSTAVASLPEPTSVASNSSIQTPPTAQSQQESATSRGEEQEGPSQLDVGAQVKEKNKAQTELAKQKMEQLKQQARLSKTAVQQPPVDSLSLPAPTSNLPSIPRNYPQPGGFLPSESLPPRPEPRQYHQAGVESLPSRPPPRPISPRTPRPQVHSTTQHALTDTTERQRSVFQIPGLFMTGPELAPPQTVESPPPPQAIESPPLLQAVELQPPPGSFYQWLEYRQSVVHNNLAAQSSPGTAAATQAPSNALMEPVQELSTLEHLSTPDFNEESGPESKRPFGKDREIPVQFDISEDEMAYDNEGSDMEMDDSTNEEESEVRPTANETTQATTVNDAPTHIDLPARKPYLPSSSIMTPPIASTPQTPGKGNDREDLRRKDQQIEEMKRKIKEMEMRRKAKQPSSRTQTPSAPNLPAVLPEDTNAAQNADAIASPAEGRRLYIGNLARTTTEDDVKDFFKGYSVESCSIPASPRTQRPAGHAFVDLTTAPEAHRAISELSGKEMLDRKVLIQFARIPAEKNEASSGEGSVREGQRAQTPPEIQPKDVDSTVAPSGTYSSPAATNSQQVIEDQVRPSLVFQHVPVEPQISSPIPSKRPEMDSSAMSSSPMRQLDPVKAQQIEMKRKRKAELESGLPILDAEVERARSKLDQMRREMERMEEEIRKGLEGRKLLVQELEALGIETEGIPTDELQAKMDQIVEEQNLAQNTLPG